MDGQTRISAPTTSSPTWDEIIAAQRRLDRVPMRRYVKDRLRTISPYLKDRDPDDISADPLRGWQRLGQALHTGSESPLDRYVSIYQIELLPGVLRADPPDAGDAARPWAERAETIVSALLAFVPDDLPDRDAYRALVLGFCYLECVVFWEYTTDVDPLRRVLDAVVAEARTAGLAAADGSAPGVSELLDAIGAAALGLQHEFDVEDDGWMCGCPVKVGAASAIAAASLESALAPVVGSEVVSSDGETDAGAMVSGLQRVIHESVEDARRYMVLLRDHVAPVAEQFVDNLNERGDRPELVRDLRRARDAVAAATRAVAPGSSAVGPDAIAGVFRTEARAQGRAVDAMLGLVDRKDPVPTLVVRHGEIHYLYPFSLTTGPSGIDQVQRELKRHFSGTGSVISTRPKLAGRSVTIEDALQTEVFSHAAEAFDLGGHGASMRLVFADDHLVLDTAAGVRYAGLDIEVVVGSLGNHLVRIAVTTAMTPQWCEMGAAHGRHVDDRTMPCAGTTFEPLAGEWTPHDLDQFLHRGGLDFGPEKLFFVDGDGTHDPPDRVWPSAIWLAAEIVNDLHEIVAVLTEAERSASPTAEDEPADTELPSIDPPEVLDTEERAVRLRQQAHVLVVLNDCVSVCGGTESPVTDPASLVASAGAGPVLAPQPPCPRVLEEWTSAPPVRVRPDGTDGYLGSMDGWILCNGDTTLMFAPASPNWQVIEDRELVMFALSLGSAYSRTRQRLLRSSANARERDTPQDLSDLPRRTLQDLVDEVRAAEQELNDQIAFADELQTNATGAAMIRPRRDRAVLEHVNERSGVKALEAAMNATREVAIDRQADLRDTVGSIMEAQRRRGQTLVERLLLAIGVLALIDLFWWYFEMHKGENEPVTTSWFIFYWVVVGVMALLCGAVLLSVFRSGRPMRPAPEKRDQGQV